MMPWVIIDFKRDELINSIEKAEYITFDSELPKRPGIYILPVLPGEEVELTDFFWRVYNRADGSYENAIGIYVDESTMIDRSNKAFHAILTQGRSKKIPVFILTQRPRHLSVYCFSEASIYQVFDLIRKDDRIKVAEDTGVSPYYKLDDYHSYYFIVSDKSLHKLSPVPDEETILAKIDAKLPTRRLKAM